MAQIEMTRSSAAGFDTTEIDTGALALTIIPALGGKISSLRDRRSGREWLWRHPRMAYAQVPHGSVYTTSADTGGWDECFPSVAACAYPSAPWAGADVQDHGELWSQPAGLALHEDGDRAELTTRWQGVALPYTLERRIALRAGSATLRVEYCALSQADAPIAFIWCIHALLAIEPGMQLLLPPAARFNRWAELPDGLLAGERGLRYPPPLTAGAPSLASLPDRSAGVALKLWSDPLPAGAGWATLRAGDGELRMRWDVARLPQLAIWMNLGAWAADGGAPYYNLGLEPCIGAQDSLAQAVTTEHLFATLPPRGTYTWWLEIELAA